MMHPFEHRLRNSQRNIASLVAGTAFSEHKHTRFILEKLANFVCTQVPHFRDFPDSIMSFSMNGGLNSDRDSGGFHKRSF
jgi:hypothetical protein